MSSAFRHFLPEGQRQKMFDKIVGRVKEAVQPQSEVVSLPIEGKWDAPPTQAQIYRYRKQRGVNLGSWFTLEAWITPSLFEGVKNAHSEYDLCKELGERAARERLDRHWRTFIDDGDWQWMKSQGITSVRLPISYYHFLPGHPDKKVASLLADTEYERFGNIYRSALQYVRSAVEKAAQHGIGVLIDLHAAPGGQNSEGHSGLSGRKADFFNHSRNTTKTIQILCALIDFFAPYPNVIGVELLNEPHNDGKLADWYKEAINTVRRETKHPHLPLYLGDCWDMQKYAGLISSYNNEAGPLLMDHHHYRCFTPQDHETSASQHAQGLQPQSSGPWLQELGGQISPQLLKGVVIGEWSAALNPASLRDCHGREKEAHTAWANAQLNAFNMHCAGHFFWTLKKEGSTDVGWCLYSAIEQGVLPSGLGRYPGRSVDLGKLQQRGREECEANYRGHVQYWSQNSNGATMHHDKYRDGFNQVYKDCLAFYQSSQEEIGLSGQWVQQRARAHSQQHNSEEGEWEIVHGGQQAINCFIGALWSS